MASETMAPMVAAEHPTRRDLLEMITVSTLVIGGAAMAWPLVAQMNPSADVLAMATSDVDLSGIPEGQAVTVKWQGKPVFVRHRTQAEIEAANAADLSTMRDPQPDAARVHIPQWLVVLGNCTHLGCVPSGNQSTEARGEFGGWFCPCHGSQFDTSGRIRKGPAPTNLIVPAYEIASETRLVIGKGTEPAVG